MTTSTRIQGGASDRTGYITVADADATDAKVSELGGRVLEEPRDIPGVGRIGMFTDPQESSSM